jgi:GntR family transcriptional regulator / MocR family aminotransferase
VQRALADAPDAALDYGDYRGRVELRTALSVYLARVRGVRVDPGRIVITQGFTQALDLLCRVLAASGRATVAMETPSHPGLWATVRQSGLTLAGCPVDEQGLRPAELPGLGADAVVVSPADQFPTGAVMPPARRLALIQWAATHDGLVIEDDYDAEFRYDRTPFGAVQGLDPRLVAHVGSASKTLAPGVRLGWISARAELVSDLVARKSAADSGSPAIDQLALADLLSGGEYERHVARARHIYRRRRDLLVRALAGSLAADPRRRGRDAVAALARRRHRRRRPRGSRRSTGHQHLGPLAAPPGPQPERGLLIGFGRLPEHKIGPAVEALSSVLRQAGRERPRWLTGG